jgi:heptosyltransferase-2
MQAAFSGCRDCHLMKNALDPNRIRNLLIRGTNWVGDSILSLPALKRARQVFPKAHISLLVLPWVSGIYDECTAVDEVMTYDRAAAHRGFRGRIKLVRWLRERHFDAAILFQNAFEGAFLAALAGIPIRAGYDRDGRGWLLSHRVPVDERVSRLHQTYYYLDLMDQLLQCERVALSAAALRGSTAAAPGRPDISLQVSHSRKQLAKALMQARGVDFRTKVVGVNPGASYGSAKRWLSDRYASLLDKLIEHEAAAVVIFGAANEIAIAQSIQSTMRHTPVMLSGRTQLSELIAMIACCSLFITNDSGPMHLAAALRVPTLAIFGPTDAIATGPMSPSAVVVNKNVECSPCLLRECPIDHRCMTQISVEDVYNQATRMLREGRRIATGSDWNSGFAE